MATTAWFRDAYIILHADRDGTLGYSDGMTYYPVYGRLQPASGVPPVTANISQQMERLTKIRLGLEQAGLEHTLRESYRREETTTLDNILFKYEETRGVYQTEVAYVQEEWNSRHYVRRLFSSALRGRGAMLSSIKNRVYVLDSSIPRPSPWIKRGYLKVGSSDLVERFFETIDWASRCEGVWKMRAETGVMVDTFVIKDRSRRPTVGYYVVCTRSRVTNALICHLEPIGGTKDAMRKWVRHRGDSKLGPWGHRVHNAETFLFD